MIDFNHEIDRHNTHSLKWDHFPADVLPLWVADMDFPSPQPVVDALVKRAQHGVFGYTLVPEELTNTIIQRLQRLYNWRIDAQSIVWLPGLVPGVNMTVKAIAKPGDDVLVISPIYPPFLDAPVQSGCRTVPVGMICKDNRWQIDWDAMDAAVTPSMKLLLFCSPQNPTGRIWNKEELSQLSAFCEAHQLVICSDEIHCDFLLDEDKPHIPVATLSSDTEARTITLFSAGKTFNIAGLNCGFAVIPNPELRKTFVQTGEGVRPFVNLMGLEATLAAYRDGQPWLDDLLTVLRENRDRVESVVANTPGLSMTHTEATYLAWIDARGLDVASPFDYYLNRKLGLSDGAAFGLPGYVRLNFGCPPSLLEKALRLL